MRTARKNAIVSQKSAFILLRASIKLIFTWCQSSQTTMQFITIIETNHKEHEVFFHYCQLNGNEDELNKLMKVIDQSEYGELYGDVSTFKCSPIRISEAAVDEHVPLDYGCYDSMFQKHVGVFKCPEFECLDDEHEAAKFLDNCFYACRLRDYFHNT
jgi:hypothetical protein